MNVGYTNFNNRNTDENLLICPICDSDIYANKYGGNFYCTNKECALNGRKGKYRNAGELINVIRELIKMC